MQQPDDHVSLFFYIDRDFVGSARSLHLHVRLTGGEERRPSQESPQTNRRPKQEKPGLAFGPFVEFCEPSDTYYSPTTKVRATGSSPGTICVIGRTLISDGVLPDAIYGKIYEEGASIPASIPSDAQEGAFVSSSALLFQCYFIIHRSITNIYQFSSNFQNLSFFCFFIITFIKSKSI